jgi:beta-glucosidase
MAEQLIFPKGFMWGAATASYQIEGAYDEDGKGESIWDRFSHTPGKVINGDTGNVACDHYHRYAEDVELMKKLGLQTYRFSIAWPRIYPLGKGKVNKAGLEFYSRLVDRLLDAGILPFVTLYHWDLPQALQEIGGWPNRDVAYYFRDYAVTVAEVLGDRVKHWITHNEPWVTAVLGYQMGIHAPGVKDNAASVLAAHNLMLSHGEAVRALRQVIGEDAQLGITLNFSPAYPATDSAEDAAAARKADGFSNRWFLDPIFKSQYPADLLEGWGDLAKKLELADLTTMSVPIDFLGVNYYTRQLVRHDPQAQGGVAHLHPEGEYTEMDWEVFPQGLYDLLTRLQRDYNPAALYVTENGAAFKDVLAPGKKVHDERRIEYLKEHFAAAHRAIQDGVKLRGYYVWSLMDNFEWALGYTKRFGIVYVDYQTQARIPKESARWYHGVIQENGLKV